jgi:hypothetical protein
MKQTRSDIEKQKKSLELESQTWKMFFEQWREAFMNDDVFILQKDDEDKLMVTVWYTHSDNKQIPFAMELSYEKKQLGVLCLRRMLLSARTHADFPQFV